MSTNKENARESVSPLPPAVDGAYKEPPLTDSAFASLLKNYISSTSQSPTEDGVHEQNALIDSASGGQLENFDFSVPPLPTPDGFPRSASPPSQQDNAPDTQESLSSREQSPTRTTRMLAPPRPKGKRPRAEDFAHIATAAHRQAAYINTLRRKQKRQERAHRRSGYDGEEMMEMDRFLASNNIEIDAEDWYENSPYEQSSFPNYGTSQRGTTTDGSTTFGDTTVDGSEDTVVLADQEPSPPPPSEDSASTSERWKQRGAEGPAKARWGSQRYRAKLRAKATPEWLAGTPEERKRIEKEAVDAVPFIADAVRIGPTPVRNRAPWLRSERETLLRIIDQRNRTPTLKNTPSIVSDIYNKQLSGVRQLRGEFCIAPGSGLTRRDGKLTEDRDPPVRTAVSIHANLLKWIQQGTVCDCREHQQYLIGDFDKSGGFPYGHGVRQCILPDDRVDHCKCGSHARDYNGLFPAGHKADRCDTSDDQ